MLDALDPFVKALQQGAGLKAAVEVAERGAEATARMQPRLGRSSYLGDRVLGHPDPARRRSPFGCVRLARRFSCLRRPWNIAADVAFCHRPCSSSFRACRRSFGPKPTFIMTYHGPFQAASSGAQNIGLVPRCIERSDDRPRVHGHDVGGEHQQMAISSWVHLFGTPSPAHWAEIHHLIRKTGHFVGYGLVSLAFFYSWRQTLHRMAVKHWTLWRRASVLAVLCTLVVASLDEYHQSFLPSRTSSPIDVGIDLCGAIAFQLVLLLISQWLVRRRPRYRAA